MTFIYTFLLMAGFWLLLSGKFDAFHLTLGLLCCLVVSLVSKDLLFEDKKEKDRIGIAWRFTWYLPWLFWQIFLANLHVAYLTLHPRMKEKIDPRIIRFKTRLKKDLAKVTLANSITLTPGTITVRIVGDEFLVHAISQKAAGDLPGDEIPAKMEDQVRRVFRGD